MPGSDDPLAAQAEALLRRVERHAREWHRDDLVAELRTELAAPHATGAITVAVCGETKRGKSALINAILGRPGLLPVSAEQSTATHVIVRECETGEPEGAAAHRSDGEPKRLQLGDLERWVTDRGPAENDVRWVEVYLEHPLLAKGIVLMDTPGVGGLARAHGQLALAALSGAEAAVLVVDVNAPISAPELDFLVAGSERVEDVVLALNRVDSQHGWRDVMSETAALVARRLPASVEPTLLPVSARMKTRADRLLADAGDKELAAGLADDSGVLRLTQRLERWIGGRRGALRAARLCRVAEQISLRMRAAEAAAVEARGAGEDELAERLRASVHTLDDLKTALPTLRRRMSNSARLAQREIDTSSTTRLNGLRREFDGRVAEGKLDDIENDLEAALLSELEVSLTEVRTRLESAARELHESLEPLGARVPLEATELDAQARPNLGLVEMPPVKSGGLELLSRAPFAVGAVVLNPLYAVVAVAGLLFDRQRLKRRAERDQLSRQIGETVSEARNQISLLINQASLNGQELLTEIFEEAVASRREELDEEVGALAGRQSQSQEERSRLDTATEARLKAIDDVLSRVAETRRAALAALRGGGAV